MQYVKSLDGIRGVAVLLVMLFHFGYLPAGWIGVQIFFTLSGYLITRILLDDRGSSFLAYAGRFYWRRTLRIFPAFYGFLLVVAVVYALWDAPASFSSDWPWLATYTANIARVLGDDPGPYFIHIWSLAVEEQFYLIWPLVLFFLTPRSLRRVVIAIVLLGPVVRLATFYGLRALGHGAQDNADDIYVLTFTQLDAFALGAAIPLWGLERMRNAARWFLGALGICAVAGCAVLIGGRYLGRPSGYLLTFGYGPVLIDFYQYVWAYSMINMVSMLGIVCALQGIGLTRVLESDPLVRMGKVSYGAYIYHLPLLLFGRFVMERMGIELGGVARLGFFAGWVAVVYLLSEASFRWYESPFLRLKDRWGKRGSAPAPQRPAA